MTNRTDKLKAAAEMHTEGQLKSMALGLVGRHDEEADMVMQAILEVLEVRMAEAEFVSFCDML